jgi:uncharacterized protein (DUF58 family)
LAEAAPALTPAGSALRAEALGARLPPLVVAAERVAATVMQGVHGRRRAGQGDAFWQFRPYTPGDALNRLDWRQSAKSDRLFVRETEWEAAQSVALWREPGQTMRWSGAPTLPQKLERAELLLLALASLLLRGGERVRLLGQRRAWAGRGVLPSLADALARHQAPAADDALPRHARAVLFSDFLTPLEETRAAVAALSGRGIRGHLLQVLDPAEETLPYAGRRRFQDMGTSEVEMLPRVEALRDTYKERLATHRAALTALARQGGAGFATHRTDVPAATALMALWQALAPA